MFGSKKKNEVTKVETESTPEVDKVAMKEMESDINQMKKDMTSYHEAIEAKKEQVREEQERFHAIKKQFDYYQKEASQLAAAKKSIYQKSLNLDASLQEVSSQTSDAKFQIEKMAEEIKFLKKEITEKQQSITEKKKEISQYKWEKKNIENQLEVVELKVNTQSLIDAKLDKEVRAVEKELRQTHGLIESKHLELSQIENDLNYKKDLLSQKESEYKKIKATYESKTKEVIRINEIKDENTKTN
jgi:chromosome segregation protein